jgi:hypothetical protein
MLDKVNLLFSNFATIPEFEGDRLLANLEQLFTAEEFAELVQAALDRAFQNKDKSCGCVIYSSLQWQVLECQRQLSGISS